MSAGTDPFEHEDAAYVLGALSHDERIAYEDHLQTCPRCSTAVAELAAMPGLLARLPGMPAPTRTVDPPPETVLPGLLAAVRRARSRRRTWTAAAGIAAAAAIVVGTATVTQHLQTAPQVAALPGAEVALTAVGDAHLEAELRLQAVSWGTRITMTCRDEDPTDGRSYDTGGTYQLVVVPADGAGVAESVASWQVIPDRAAVVAGSTALSPDQIAEVQLRDQDGRVLLTGSPT